MILRTPLLSWVFGCIAIACVLAGFSRHDLSAVDRGRLVYAGEGCVHCHSQYIRPEGDDRDRWGEYAVRNTAQVGNRRQGPDLSTIGRRAGAEYLRIHLTAPSRISPGTVMPSYAHLFSAGNPQGEELLAYLLSLKGELP